MEYATRSPRPHSSMQESEGETGTGHTIIMENRYQIDDGKVKRMNQRAKDEILKAVNEYIADENEEKLFYAIESICKGTMFFGIPK